MKLLLIGIVSVFILASCASKRIDQRCNGIFDRDELRECIRITNRMRSLERSTDRR